MRVHLSAARQNMGNAGTMSAARQNMGIAGTLSAARYNMGNEGTLSAARQNMGNAGTLSAARQNMGNAGTMEGSQVGYAVIVKCAQNTISLTCGHYLRIEKRRGRLSVDSSLKYNQFFFWYSNNLARSVQHKFDKPTKTTTMA